MYYNFNLNKFCESNLAKDKLAIVGSDREINWGDLKLEVEEYKLLFQRLQIPKGHPVIIYGNKEASFLVVLLALINSDIPYIPFDQSYPDEWLLKIKNITGSNVVIKVGEYNLEEEYSIIIEYIADGNFKAAAIVYNIQSGIYRPLYYREVELSPFTLQYETLFEITDMDVWGYSLTSMLDDIIYAKTQ